MQSRNFNSASLSAAGTPATNLCVAEPLVSRSKTGRCEWSHQSSPTRCDSLCMAPGRGPTMHFSRRRGAKRQGNRKQRLRRSAASACWAAGQCRTQSLPLSPLLERDVAHAPKAGRLVPPTAP
jgi:hypothetical protein